MTSGTALGSETISRTNAARSAAASLGARAISFLRVAAPVPSPWLQRRRIDGPSPTALAAHSTTTTLDFCRFKFPRPTGQSGRATPADMRAATVDYEITTEISLLFFSSKGNENNWK